MTTTALTEQVEAVASFLSGPLFSLSLSVLHLLSSLSFTSSRRSAARSPRRLLERSKRNHTNVLTLILEFCKLKLLLIRPPS